jgi:hypothetical protein
LILFIPIPILLVLPTFGKLPTTLRFLASWLTPGATIIY